MEFTETLFSALKKDNLKAFRSCMEENSCGALRLGRFPVLSVLYLYNSKRILRAYEKSFLRHNSWQDIGEPAELAARFRSVAGKCLRLYLNETVSPAEMLLILDRNVKLKRVFPQINITAPAKQRLKNIYYIRWGLQADFNGDGIVLQRRPMKREEKVRWLTAALCIVLCVAVTVGTPFVVNAFAPFIADGDGVVNVSSWRQIKFGSDKIYALKNDVILEGDFFVQEMNCQLRGNGHKVTFAGGALFGRVNGRLSDIVFQTDGSPVAQEFSLFGGAQNVTVNAAVDMQTDKACAFFVTDNYGALQEVTVNVSGTLVATAVETEAETLNSFNIGGIVAHNTSTLYQGRVYYAVVQSCAANFDNFTLKGHLPANVSFGGIVGLNDASVQNCATSGKISSDTLDVGGICAENTYALSNCKNAADISQRSDVAGWSSVVAGIAVTNQNDLLNEGANLWQCENVGNLSSTSNCTEGTKENKSPTAYAAGIVSQNLTDGKAHHYLLSCINRGNVTASSANFGASAAGVCNGNGNAIRSCLNVGKISASGNIVADSAGIVNLANGYVYRSANFGEVSAVGIQEARVGGIVGTSCAQTAECYSEGAITAEGEICYVGGILGYSHGSEVKNTLYCGYVEKCVADCEITVTEKVTSKSVSAVGGTVGFVEERKWTVTDGSVIYAGGSISNCYFTGKLQASASSYVGAIAGIVGKNYYLAAVADPKINLHDNAYVEGCGKSAFGAALTDTENVQIFETVEDVGATVGTLEQIEEDKTYQSIISVAKTPFEVVREAQL